MAFMAGRSAGVEVTSAGIHSTPGARMCDLAAGVVADYDAGAAFAARFRSRHIQSLDLPSYDLVLGATREIRSEVVSQYPVLRRKAFTVKEALILLKEDLSESEQDLFRLAGAAPVMIARRGLTVNPSEVRRGLRRPGGHPMDLLDGHTARRKRQHQQTVQHAAELGAELGSALLGWHNKATGSLPTIS